MELSVKLVLHEHIKQYWPQCEPLLERGLQPGRGEANASHILQELDNQRAYLLIGVDTQDTVHVAIAIQFLPLPNYTVAHVYSIGGRGVLENAQHWGMIKNWMKQNGAIKVQGLCRPAQARLWRKLNFEEVYQVMQQDL